MLREILFGKTIEGQVTPLWMPMRIFILLGTLIVSKDFDPSNGTYNLTSALGQDDAFVVKLCQLTTPTISDLTSFCQGGSISLIAISANSYLLNTVATTQSIIVSSSGNYSVTSI